MTSKLKVNLINDGGDNNIITSDGSGVITSSKFKIGQVVSATKTDYFDGASTSYVDITGMTATITPSSTSSKVLVNIFLNLSHHSSGKFGFIKLQRYNSTDICVGDAAGSRDQVTTGRYSAYGPNGFGMNICFLDSPATTSAQQYTISMKIQAVERLRKSRRR